MSLTAVILLAASMWVFRIWALFFERPASNVASESKQGAIKVAPTGER